MNIIVSVIVNDFQYGIVSRLESASIADRMLSNTRKVYSFNIFMFITVQVD